jgi:hypothetical protein
VPVVIADDEAGIIRLIDGPGRREAALCHPFAAPEAVYLLRGVDRSADHLDGRPHAVSLRAGSVVQRCGQPGVDIDSAVVTHRQPSSASRFTAGAAGFLTFSQCADRPARYGEPSRFDTMPSQPSAHACLKMTPPSPLKCS